MRSKVLSLLRIGLGVLVLGAVVVVLVQNWGEVSENLKRVSARSVLVAALGALASPFITLLGWRVLLADLGARIPLPASSSVFFVGQLGKYLPGSVWPVVVQAEMLAKLHVPRRTSGSAGIVSMAMSVLSGAVVGLPAAPLLLRAGSAGTGGTSPWVLALAVVLLVVAMLPPVLNRLIALALRLLGREPLEHPFSGRAVVTTMAWFVLAWLTTALTIWVFAADLAPAGVDRRHLALVSLSGFCLAAVFGMLSVLLPAGVGVREGVVVILLAAVMPVEAATAIVVLSRFLTVVADVVWAGVGWLWARGHHLLPQRDEAA